MTSLDEAERRRIFEAQFERLKGSVARLPESEDPDTRENLWRAIRLHVAEIERLYPS